MISDCTGCLCRSRLVLFTLFSMLSVGLYAAPEAKVTICHIPPGNPNNPQTITVGASAVKAHLKHGDTQGACATPQCTSAAQCNDNNLCTSDNCVAGACTNTPVTCNSGNPCLIDSCSPTAGCTTALKADGTVCNDGQACTNLDQCLAGTCQGTPVIYQADACHTATCDINTGNPIYTPIDINDGNNCTTDSCDSVTGPAHTPIAYCCLADANCNDGNACTLDSCNLAGNTCVNTPAVGQACSDANLCTSGDVCTASGTCEGSAVSCVSSNPCLLGSCDALSGLCLYQPDVSLAGVACNDGVACTGNDQCNSLGQCSGSDSCVAPVACASSSCNLGSGSCDVVANNASCDDHIPCTADSCDLLGGCSHDTYACECIALTSDIRCDDSNPCTNDICGANYDCQHDITGTNGYACSDGNACTAPDTCLTGVCVAGAAINVDDANACTTDSCLPASGPQHDPVVCNDSDICTADTCNVSTGCQYAAIDPSHPTQCIVASTTTCADLLTDPGNCGTCGTVCPSGVCQSGACTSIPINYKAFISETDVYLIYTGGIGAYDAACQSEAVSAGLPGTFKAWLSSSTIDAKDRFPSNQAYYRTDGALIANDMADLIDGTIANPIMLNASGIIGGSSSFVLTGTRLGLKDSGGGDFLNDWTLEPSNAPIGALFGFSHLTTGDEWESYDFIAGRELFFWSFYCFQSGP